MRKFKTIKECSELMIKEFNAISTTLVEKILVLDYDSWNELTTICKGDIVYCYELDECGEVEKIDYKNNILFISGNEYNIDDCEKYNDSYLPMWGTMWEVDNFTQSFIKDNLELVSSLGFRIYEYEEENSLYIGIDGAGYDFYEAHWIPLYKAMGLQWHDEEN